MGWRALAPGGAASRPWRALVLAAGFGTRLRPLTAARPKPLIPVLGSSVLRRTLERLESAGCEAAAVNLHHRGRDIVEAIGERIGELTIRYSWEEEIRGTFGALAPLKEFFEGREIVVVNGDSICRWPFEALLRRHRRAGADATLLLAARPDPRRFGGGVAVSADGRITGFGRGEGEESSRRRVFAGAQVLGPALLERVPEGFAGLVIDLYRPMLSEGEEIASVTTRRRWHDLGTPKRVLEGILERARGIFRRSWISPGSQVDDGAVVRRAAIEEGVWVASGTRVERSFLLPGARIESGCRLRETIVGDDALVPAGTEVAGRLLTRARSDAETPPGSSRLGGLVLSPLDPVDR